MAMNKEIKEKWIEALRSGQYTQAREVLCEFGRAERYCCLGVLALVCGAKRHNDGPGLEWEGNLIGGWLNAPFKAHVGLTDEEVDTFADLNDEQKLSFPKIADYVEAHV